MSNEEKILSMLTKVQGDVEKLKSQPENKNAIADLQYLLSICLIVYYEIICDFKVSNASKQLKKLNRLSKTTTFTLRQFQSSTLARLLRQKRGISDASKF